MAKVRTCEICKAQEAVYAVQCVADEEPTLSTLGSHYRGFPIVARVCGDCGDKISSGELAIERTA